MAMNCQICSRHHSEITGLQCPGCAWATLYPLRLQHAEALVEKERIGRQVESAVAAGGSTKATKTESCGANNDIEKTVKYSRQLSDIAESRETIDTISQHAAALRANIDELRKRLGEERAAVKRRQEAMERSRKELAEKRSHHTTAVQTANKDRARRNDAQYRDVVAMRIRRCKSAATFAGLTQVLKPVDGNKRTPQYCIWNMLIPDIRQLNSTEPTHVSTMLYYIARLLCQLASYFHVRLPAEITLPHADWPMPTIYSPASSYSGRNIAFPKASPSSSKEGSSKSSRELEQRTAGRPRVLSIDRKLPKLARENPVAYSLFVEGTALLAWNIAWLCRVQGLPVAEKDWDDVCDLGRNLWLLFANAPDAQTALPRRRSSKDPIVTVKQADGVKAFSPTVAPAALGVHSHGSAHHFLEGAMPSDSGMCDVSAKGWAFAFPVKIIDEFRAALLTDMSGYDWELLDDREDEFADGTDAEENIVVDQTGQRPRRDTVGSAEKLDERKGTSGWTKLKSRNPD